MTSAALNTRAWLRKYADSSRSTASSESRPWVCSRTSTSAISANAAPAQYTVLNDALREHAGALLRQAALGAAAETRAIVQTAPGAGFGLHAGAHAQHLLEIRRQPLRQPRILVRDERVQQVAELVQRDPVVLQRLAARHSPASASRPTRRRRDSSSRSAPARDDAGAGMTTTCARLRGKRPNGSDAARAAVCSHGTTLRARLGRKAGEHRDIEVAPGSAMRSVSKRPNTANA